MQSDGTDPAELPVCGMVCDPCRGGDLLRLTLGVGLYEAPHRARVFPRLTFRRSFVIDLLFHRASYFLKPNYLWSCLKRKIETAPFHFDQVERIICG